MSSISFTPSSEVVEILNALLTMFERREGQRAIRFYVNAQTLPNYFNQTDPAPRQVANEQLKKLEAAEMIRLAWVRGETNHLLESVTLTSSHADAAFALVKRTPLASHRARLTEILLGERFRFGDWRLRALQHTLTQLKEEKSPTPFSLSDEEFNRDLLTALTKIDDVREETPYRVFSARLFNDSKRFEEVMNAIATLGRRHNDDWRELENHEVLRELNLVANPTHLYLHGAWELVDELGQVMSLNEFQPSVGIPSAQAAKLRQVRVAASPVIGVENPTSFYELIRHDPNVIAICLWGNPSPACRHLLQCIDAEVRVWADMDYGGFNILAQIREQVNARAQPYLMDVATFEAHSKWAKPITTGDAKNLERLLHRPSLEDMREVIKHLLQRGLKLEQEAILLR